MIDGNCTFYKITLSKGTLGRIHDVHAYRIVLGGLEHPLRAQPEGTGRHRGRLPQETMGHRLKLMVREAKSQGRV
jgi:hypothetical protein